MFEIKVYLYIHVELKKIDVGQHAVTIKEYILEMFVLFLSDQMRLIVCMYVLFVYAFDLMAIDKVVKEIGIMVKEMLHGYYSGTFIYTETCKFTVILRRLLQKLEKEIRNLQSLFSTEMYIIISLEVLYTLVNLSLSS